VAGDIVAGNNVNINRYSGAFSASVTQNGAVQWFVQDKSGGNRMIGVNDGNNGAGLMQDLTLAAKAAEIEADMLFATTELCKVTATSNALLNTNTQNVFLTISDMTTAVVNLSAIEAADFFNNTTSFTINTPNNNTYDKPIIINIKGATYSVPSSFNMGNIQSQLYDNVIWNFCEATSINIPSVVKGSLLAPMADVTLGNNIDGVLVGRDISIGSESHLPFLGVDFSDFCGSELVGIGGTVFEDIGSGGAVENDGTQEGTEMGVSGVTLQLFRDVNEDLMISGSETTPIATTTSSSDGTYLFECLQPGKYQIRIPTNNFMGALSGLPSSSVPTNNTNDDDMDNDDNGVQPAPMAEVISPVYMLVVDKEPNSSQEILTPVQDGFDNSPRDKNTNTTVDFGFQTVPLPVELLSFKAVADKGYVMLKWLTTSEVENSHFNLERSEDSKTFKSIARVEGNGTTLELSEYHFEDRKVIIGNTYYYRLKQVDFDGAISYSEIQTAKLE
ncbi:MAG: collagen-binding domain-containing protein, partial [Bacteroidota bacterium]